MCATHDLDAVELLLRTRYIKTSAPTSHEVKRSSENLDELLSRRLHVVREEEGQDGQLSLLSPGELGETALHTPTPPRSG